MTVGQDECNLISYTPLFYLHLPNIDCRFFLSSHARICFSNILANWYVLNVEIVQHNTLISTCCWVVCCYNLFVCLRAVYSSRNDVRRCIRRWQHWWCFLFRGASDASTDQLLRWADSDQPQSEAGGVRVHMWCRFPWPCSVLHAS